MTENFFKTIIIRLLAIMTALTIAPSATVFAANNGVKANISPKKAAMKVGEELSFTLDGVPAQADQNVSWSVDAGDVVQILNGKARAVGQGRAKVSATLDGKRYTAKVNVTGGESTENLYTGLGKSRKIKGKGAALYVVSGNSAAIRKNKITVVSAGMSVVKAGFSDGSRKVYRVFAEDDTLSTGNGISGSDHKYSLDLNVSENRLLYAPGLHRIPEWTSSDPGIATVSGFGVVTGKAAGKAVITSKINGKKTAVTVNVGPCDHITPGETHTLHAIDAINGKEGYRVLINDIGEYTIETIPAGSDDHIDENKTDDYGVFLSVEKSFEKMKNYGTVVIDAQYFDKKDILEFKEQGHKVYTYINVGSIEDFRDYYDEYKALALGNYEHWEEEMWVNVAEEKWQDFILKELTPQLLDKGVDGFFVDNCDVYYEYPKDDILNGLTIIMKGLRATGKAVVMNSGDVFIDKYCENGGSWDDVITGINQETVFSKINWNKNSFGKASAEDSKYFRDYIEKYASLGADIYLLEYTKDPQVMADIAEYCRIHGFKYYISDSIELD